MKTIFSTGKKYLREPRFVVVYANGPHREYDSRAYGETEQEQRNWRQERIKWGKDRQFPQRRVAYLINVYPRAQP